MARKQPAAVGLTPDPKPAAAPADQSSTEQPAADEQSAAPPQVAAAEPEMAAAPAPENEQPVPELDDFVARHERAAQDVDLVVTAISHPHAKPGHRIGVYSGFPIANGPLRATYSDGSTHQ